MDLIRFDWETKRLLRQKANYAVLEGLLSVLLNDSVNVLYFDLGQGKDYSYHGYTDSSRGRVQQNSRYTVRRMVFVSQDGRNSRPHYRSRFTRSKGTSQANRMNKEEQRDYDTHLENLRFQRSVIQTGIIEGKAEGLEKATINGHLADYPTDVISTVTGLTAGQITEILKRNRLI